jgi:hypothetical protein
MLLGTHNEPDGSTSKSAFRKTVEQYQAGGATWAAALARTGREQIDSTIEDADIGNINNLDNGDQVRAGLLLDDAAYYAGGGQACPGAIQVHGSTADHQKAIASALLAMHGPVMH